MGGGQSISRLREIDGPIPINEELAAREVNGYRNQGETPLIAIPILRRGTVPLSQSLARGRWDTPQTRTPSLSH